MNTAINTHVILATPATGIKLAVGTLSISDSEVQDRPQLHGTNTTFQNMSGFCLTLRRVRFGVILCPYKFLYKVFLYGISRKFFLLAVGPS